MISFQNLTFRYDKKYIFRQFTHEFPDNLLCFGHNGSGKTTFIKLVAGILTPENGSILMDQKDDFRASILLDNRILFDDVCLKSHINWIRSEFSVQQEVINQQIHAFEIERYLERKPAELSDGERQWTALALVTLIPAEICLIDEPIRSLDNDKMQQFCDILDHKIQSGKKFIITAHRTDPFASILEPFDMNSIQA